MNHYDVTPLKERMDKIAEVIRKLNIYDDKLVSYRLNEYKNHDFTQYAMDEFATPGEDDNVSDDEWDEEEEESEDCLEHIPTYAGYTPERIEDMRNLIRKYRSFRICFPRMRKCSSLENSFHRSFMMHIIKYL